MANNSDEQLTKHASIRATAIAIFAVIFVVGLFVGNYFYAKSLNDPDKQSAFGSQFGATAALFSGLAFVGVIYAILLQSQELRLQREELKLTRKEMEETREEIEGQKKALELQSETMIKQQFESTFFTILNRLDDKSAELISAGTKLDRNMFQLFCFQVREIIIRNIEAPQILMKINKLLKQEDEHYPAFVSYRNLLLSLYRFLETSIIKDKFFYANLILASFSTEELLYHYLTAFADDKKRLKYYFESYSTFQIFKGNYENEEYYFQFAKKQYAPSAFEEASNN